MVDLQSLIERLEKAEGPRYELDVAIFEALGARRSRIPDEIGCPVWIYHGQTRSAPPPYTASLDAAVGLVRDGAGWTVSNLAVPLDDGRKHGATCDGQAAHFLGATPAIALCIAALKAQASEES